MEQVRACQIIPEDLLFEIFEYTFEWSQDAMAIVSVSGDILQVNQMFETFTGCKRSLAVGRKLESFVGEEFRGNLMKNILDIATIGIAWMVVGKKSDGENHDVILSARVARSKGVPFFILTQRTATGERVIEKQLMKAHSQANLGLLVGSIAHEFNNILTGIHGYSELVLASINSDGASDIKQYIEKLGYAAMKGVKWSRKILSTINSNELVVHEEVDINEIVSSVVEFLKLTMPKNINIRVELTHGVGKITGDPFQIEQALMNLVINAGHAMPTGGVITVRTYNHREEDKDYLVLSVADTGLGINPDIQNKIYKPFFTTKNGNGTGLGLYIVSLVMKNHNGLLNIHSQIGKGTRFEMNFPVF